MNDTDIRPAPGDERQHFTHTLTHDGRGVPLDPPLTFQITLGRNMIDLLHAQKDEHRVLIRITPDAPQDAVNLRAWDATDPNGSPFLDEALTYAQHTPTSLRRSP